MAEIPGLETFEGRAGEILSQIVTGGFAIILILILAGVILGVALYVRYLRQFNVKVEIISIRGGGTKEEPIYKIINDVGGFIVNKKDQTRFFRLRGEKVDLPSPPLESLQLDAKGRNHIKIFQKSDTEYYYMFPDKIDTKYVVREGKDIPIAQMSLKISEGDVAYWGQLRKRDNKKLFDTESIIMKLLPFLIPMLMFMLVIFLTYMITDHWGDFASAASALRDAAQALRDTGCTSTATVTQG